MVTERITIKLAEAVAKRLTEIAFVNEVPAAVLASALVAVGLESFGDALLKSPPPPEGKLDLGSYLAKIIH
jgi:hypothetical protein